mmetsp:Transcript_3544/g.13692  ORF Transcript_3544/g.13692 Transcript_3544/m.13692 type:complete len:259 (+) Transcript_3544:537-1313(+)
MLLHGGRVLRVDRRRESRRGGQGVQRRRRRRRGARGRSGADNARTRRGAHRARRSQGTRTDGGQVRTEKGGRQGRKQVLATARGGSRNRATAQGDGTRRKPRGARGEIERWLQRPSRQDSRGFVRAKVERDVRRGEEADRGRSHHGGVAIHDWGVAFEGRRVALRAAFQLVLSSRRRRCDANQHSRSRFDSRSDFVDEKSQSAARTRRRRRHVVLSKVHQRPRRSDCVRGARRASAQDFENLDGFDASFQRVCHHSHR